jgi:tRNA pseudouridine38-40 synthase
VHALLQVVHFDTHAVRPPQAWVRGVNARLPATVRVMWVRPVPDNFHARFSALRRQYVYVLGTAAVAHPLWHGRAGWALRPLCLTSMRQAAAQLCGEHDFSSFRSAQCQARSPVRTLYRLDLEQRGSWLVLNFEANAFLHHMVRNLLGALVWVGEGRKTPDWVTAALAARSRSAAGPTFAAAGLYFCGARYASVLELPSPDGDPVGSLGF